MASSRIVLEQFSDVDLSDFEDMEEFKACLTPGGQGHRSEVKETVSSHIPSVNTNSQSSPSMKALISSLRSKRRNGWSELERAQHLSMSLRGTAQKLRSNLTVGQLADYYTLKSVLEQRFNPRERVIAYRSEFRNRRQGKSESASDFGYQLRRLALQAYPQVPYNSLELQVVDQFIYGLSDFEMRKEVSFSHPRTLDQAISSAVEYEAVVGTRFPKSEHKPQCVGAIGSNSQLSVSLTWEDIAKLIDQKLAQEGNKARKSVDRYRCRYCKKRGHWKASCPKLIAKNSRAKIQSKEREITTESLGVPLASVSPSSGCLYAEVEFSGQFCRLLVDSGSPVSILSLKEFHRLGLSVTSLHKAGTSLTGADGKGLEVKGEITLSFEIGSLTFEQSFVVASLDSLPGILGWNFLDKYRCEIHICGQTLKTSLGEIDLSKQMSISCSRVGNIVVPVHSELAGESCSLGHSPGDCSKPTEHKICGGRVNRRRKMKSRRRKVLNPRFEHHGDVVQQRGGSRQEPEMTVVDQHVEVLASGPTRGGVGGPDPFADTPG